MRLAYEDKRDLYCNTIVCSLRAPGDKLNASLVARPGATVNGTKHITRSPWRPEHPTTVARHYNAVPATLWPSDLGIYLTD